LIAGWRGLDENADVQQYGQTCLRLEAD